MRRALGSHAEDLSPEPASTGTCRGSNDRNVGFRTVTLRQYEKGLREAGRLASEDTPAVAQGREDIVGNVLIKGNRILQN